MSFSIRAVQTNKLKLFSNIQKNMYVYICTVITNQEEMAFALFSKQKSSVVVEINRKN